MLLVVDSIIVSPTLVFSVFYVLLMFGLVIAMLISHQKAQKALDNMEICLDILEREYRRRMRARVEEMRKKEAQNT